MYKPAFPTGSKDITDITTNCTFLLEMFSTFKITQHSEQNFEIYWSCLVLSVHKRTYFWKKKSIFLSFWNSFQTLEWLGADCDQMQCNQIKSAKFKWKKVLTLWKKSFLIMQEICSPFLKNQFEIFEYKLLVAVRQFQSNKEICAKFKISFKTFRMIRCWGIIPIK